MSIGHLMATFTSPGRAPQPASATRHSKRKAGAMVLLGATLTAVLQLPAISPAEASPTPPALWAMSVDPDALTLQKSILMTTGLVHSEGGLHILRAKGSLTGGTEYGGTYWAKMSNIKVKPAAKMITPGQGHPPVPAVADYRPGGPAALAASSYTAVDPASCVGDYWTPDPNTKYKGVVYVPCSLSLTGGKQRTVEASFVAEGKIVVWASKLTIGQSSTAPSLLSGFTGEGSILISGTKLTTRGTVVSPDGNVRITSAAAVLNCGVQSQVITMYKASVKVPLPAYCTA